MSERFFTVFDTETTGVGNDDRPCQIAVAVVDASTFSIAAFKSVLVNPERLIHPNAQAVHGISDDMVKNEPTLKEVFETELKPLFATSMYCGHNVQFDMRMCHDVLGDRNVEIFDTLKLARCEYPKLRNHKLQTLVKELELPRRDAHDALGDVFSCVDFLIHVANGRDAFELYRHSNECRKAARKALLAKFRI